MNFLIQIKADTTLPGLLIIGITGCVAAIVTLSLYIRFLIKRLLYLSTTLTTEIALLKGVIEDNTEAIKEQTRVTQKYHDIVVSRLLQ